MVARILAERRTIRVGLLWHSMNSDNLGVGAMTLGHIALIEDVTERLGLAVRFVVLGWKDPRPYYLAGNNIVVRGFELRDFAKIRGGLLSALSDCDIVLDIGAGDSFSETYGIGRAAKIIQAQYQVLLSRRPLVLSPQTIGPFKSWWVRRLALYVMQRAEAVVTRDDLSTRFVREMGYVKPVVQATDVSLRLPYVEPESHQDGLLRVGINVSGLLFNGGYTGGNMFELKSDYAEVMRSILRLFHGQSGVEIHVIGHVQSEQQPVDDDQRAGEALASEFPGVVVAPNFRDPSEAKSYISGMDYFIGARMHACIAAFSSGVPVLPMAYSRKFEGVFGSLGYDTFADCRTDSTEEILGKAQAGFENRSRLKVELEAAYAKGLDRLKTYETVLEKHLGDVIEKRGRT